jgi:hypothetical protein
MKTKTILIIEGILSVGIIVFLVFYNFPKQIYPLHGMTVSNEDFLFEIENSEEVILSADANFTNFILLKSGEEITLPPGTYFWKVKGLIMDSRVRNFTIQSEASLSLKEKGELYEIENSGNVDLNLAKKQGDKITIATILNIGESEEFEKDNSTYTGGQI